MRVGNYACDHTDYGEGVDLHVCVLGVKLMRLKGYKGIVLLIYIQELYHPHAQEIIETYLIVF